MLRNFFYKNNGDGTFKKLTTNEVGSILVDKGPMASAAWADYDNDGDPDLFINRPVTTVPACCIGTTGTPPSKEWPGTTSGISSTTAGKGGGSSGSSWGDYDNDGDLDLFVSVGAEARVAPSNLLWRNNGNGTFSRMDTMKWARSLANEVGPHRAPGLITTTMAGWTCLSLALACKGAVRTTFFIETMGTGHSPK